jgi:hypothetical protein
VATPTVEILGELVSSDVATEDDGATMEELLARVPVEAKEEE